VAAFQPAKLFQVGNVAQLFHIAALFIHGKAVFHPARVVGNQAAVFSVAAFGRAAFQPAKLGMAAELIRFALSRAVLGNQVAAFQVARLFGKAAVLIKLAVLAAVAAVAVEAAALARKG